MQLRVDSNISFRAVGMRGTQVAAIQNAFKVYNAERDKAAREHIHGWDKMPEHLPLWRLEEGTFYLPRGYADRVSQVIDEEVIWDDCRVEVPVKTWGWHEVAVRDYQEVAVCAMISHEQGVYEAPAGSGKTVTVLELLRRLGQRALVIVDKTNIAAQWQDRARQHLGLTEELVGLVGDGVWREGDITLALLQTLWSRRNSLHGWWDQWGVVVLDECHHVPANTFYDIMNRFPARYRFGVSATPNKQVDREGYVRAALGPTIHQTPRDELVSKGVLSKPTVEIVPTGFEYNFWGTHRAQKDKKTQRMVCGVDGCTRVGVVHRNNYATMVSALVMDDARNDIIATRIARDLEEGRAIIILSRQLKHLDAIARKVAHMRGPEDLFRMSSKEDTAERMAIQERAEDGRIAIFSTIGDEALDIPRLDTIHLTFPSKNAGLIEQQVGRVERTHPLKSTPKVVDYADNVSVFLNQLQARTRVYSVKGLEVVRVSTS